MTSIPGINIHVNPTWSGARVGAAIVAAARSHYGDALPIDRMQTAATELWCDLHEDLTLDERKRIDEVAHIAIPTNDLNASISMTPSGNAYFVMFDAMLDVRLGEIFTAPRHQAAWAACYVRAAWGSSFNIAHWVEPKVNHLMTLESPPYPDSYSIMDARAFIFAHEYGHFFLDHLRRGFDRRVNIGDHDLAVFDPAQRDELAADRFARELLCRSEKRSVALQRMGVDWMFGFLTGVTAMRRSAEALMRGLRDVSSSNPAVDQRRAACWEDYTRRAIPEYEPDNFESASRVRMNVDNFNNGGIAMALPHIYVAAPAELLKWADAVRSPMSEKDFAPYLDELMRLGNEALARLPPPVPLRERLSAWLGQLF